MPSASDSSATPLTIGVCRICRTANFRSRTSDETNPMGRLTRTFCHRLASCATSDRKSVPGTHFRSEVGAWHQPLLRSEVGAWHQPLLAAFEGEGGPGVVDR